MNQGFHYGGEDVHQRVYLQSTAFYYKRINSIGFGSWEMTEKRNLHLQAMLSGLQQYDKDLLLCFACCLNGFCSCMPIEIRYSKRKSYF